MNLLRPLLVLLLASALGAAPPRKVAVAAASDLQFALTEVKEAFTKAQPGIEVSLTFGASGNFFAQLMSKAPLRPVPLGG